MVHGRTLVLHARAGAALLCHLLPQPASSAPPRRSEQAPAERSEGAGQRSCEGGIMPQLPEGRKEQGAPRGGDRGRWPASTNAGSYAGSCHR